MAVQAERFGLATLLRENGLVEDLASFFKVFGDSTRLKILTALLSSPSRVGDLARRLGMTQSAISHQLRLLKEMRLVRGVKSGKEVTYSLDDAHIAKILTDGFAHASERRRGGGRG
ncbi:MAG: winged helix-turn-helix transcriptional regulator [Spirochaetales bacterium]|nr:winged helix-turn-helix transcriptional regulator [Spirochaetales bacterium]